FDNRPVCNNTGLFSDGLSNTILLGEKAFNPAVETPTSWYWDEPFFIGGAKGAPRGGVRPPPARPGHAAPNNSNNGPPPPPRGGARAGGGARPAGGGGGGGRAAGTPPPAVHNALLPPDGREAVSPP